MKQIYKFPRTQHITGSGVQSDDIKETIPLSFFEGKYIVIEEKVDGGCSGLTSYNNDIVPQSRGHLLLGGDEKYWNDLKTFIALNYQDLEFYLDGTVVIYGEYMKAFHSVYYDMLPSFFLEFDIYLTVLDTWYSTKIRKDHLEKYLLDFYGLPILNSVPILGEGICKDGKVEGISILDYLSTSNYISKDAYETLGKELEKRKISGTKALLSLNKDRLMEGLYIKWEEDGKVKGRYKYVRSEFVNSIIEQGEHWRKRAYIYNKLDNSDLSVPRK